VQKYLNEKKVPQLLAGTGATRFTDPKNYPWTIAFNPNYQAEAHIYAKYILANHPNAKIGILYQNDDLGKDYVKGLKDGLGTKAASMIVAEAPYELSDPTVDSQMVKLKSSGADLFYNITTPKFGAQAIKKAAEMGWKPVQILDINASPVSQTLVPAGLDNAKDIISVNYGKDPLDPQWADDEGMKRYKAFMAKYAPGEDANSGIATYGYSDRRAACSDSQAMRRRSHPRQRHEAGGEPEGFCARYAAARYHDQHFAHRLRADRATSDDALQGREVGSVR